jgi:predicted dehydrogenase
MLKVGVIGVGAMGKHHVRVYSQIPDVELVGAADINRRLVGQIAKHFQINAFSDYQKLLNSGVEAVSICVPTSTHKEVALSAFERGIHCLVEKPIAPTVEDAKEIIKKAKQKKVKLQVGHIERFNPIVDVIKNALKGEDVVAIDIIRVGPFPPRVKDVGVIVDLGVHDIDLLSYLTDSDFDEIHALSTSSTNNYGKEDTAILSFRMKNGVLGHITTNWLTPYKVREIKVAAKDRLFVGNFITQEVIEYSRYTTDPAGYAVCKLDVPLGEPLRYELESFVDAVRNKKEPRVTGEEGLKALEVALECLKKSH